MILPEVISQEQLIKQGYLFFERIETGFAECDFHMLTGSTQEVRRAVLQCIEESTWDHSCVDFYFSALTKEEKDLVGQALLPEQVEYLRNMQIQPGQIYFQLTPRLFDITFYLSITEILFSTYYFRRPTCTVWGNYGKKFPAFYSKKEK